MNKELSENIVNATKLLGFEAFDIEDIKAYLDVFDKLRSSGCVVVIKLDGQRTDKDANPYTVVITGGNLKDDFVNLEDDNLINVLARGIVKYVTYSGLIETPSLTWKKWVEIATSNTESPKENLVCPVCSEKTLSIWDELSGDMIERHLKCSNCGAYNSMRIA